MLKKIVFILYILVIVCMAAATMVEKYQGTTFTNIYIYGSWWFTLLWAALAGCGIFYFIQRKVKRVYAVLLHVSLVTILLGALLTRLTSTQGRIHLRVGEPLDIYEVSSKDGSDIQGRKLPFKLSLRSFEVIYHDGTTTPADYRSVFTYTDGDAQREATVSMNKIFSYKSVRLYQMSYDVDMQGSTLSVNSDPWGIPVTYVGYTLLFLSLMWMLVDPKGTFRQMLRSPLLKKGMLVLIPLLTLVLPAGNVSAAVSKRELPTFPKDVAEEFGKLYILHNGRICPLQTFALDFTQKMYGSHEYKGLTAEQVITGWIFWGYEWSAEPFFKVKDKALRDAIGLPKYASLNELMSGEDGQPSVGWFKKEYYVGKTDKLHQLALGMDSKIELVLQLRRGELLKVFPYTFTESHSRNHTEAAITAGSTTWYSPTDDVHSSVEEDNRLFINKVFLLVHENAKARRYEKVSEILEKIKKYQETNAGSSLPSSTQVKAERLNNAIPFATILFMVNLTMGFIALFYVIRIFMGKRHAPAVEIGLQAVLGISLIALTVLLALRWIISGDVPMSNGYETMLLMAWLVQLISLLMCRRIRIVLVFGFLLSGLFLLVSHINQMDPSIGRMMPVLNSPLLSVHVSVIMMSYALCSLTFFCSIAAFGLRSHAAELQVLSRIFHYPAMAMMGLGIFIGAIWANQSWGVYWSWDPKETWALIAWLVYAVPLHARSLPTLQKPIAYHIYMLLAFLFILMTYFGVNYFLGGMHSYAN